MSSSQSSPKMSWFKTFLIGIPLTAAAWFTADKAVDWQARERADHQKKIEIEATRKLDSLRKANQYISSTGADPSLSKKYADTAIADAAQLAERLNDLSPEAQARISRDTLISLDSLRSLIKARKIPGDCAERADTLRNALKK